MAVLINGKTAVHQGSGGTLTTQDVCLTTDKKKPVKYSNIAKSADAANCAATVFIDGNPVCHKNSCFSKSSGDEAGDHKGKKSGTIQGKAEFVTASPNVFIEGIAAVRQGDLMVSNNKNTPPAQLQQPGAPTPKTGEDLKNEYLDKPQGPNQLNIDISGTTPGMLFGELCATDDKHNILLGQHTENNGTARRLEIRNLKEEKYDLYYTIPKSDGGTLRVLLGKELPSTKSAHKPPAAEKAPHQLVSAEIRWRTHLNNKPFDPAPGDLTAVAHLPDHIRSQVYQDIDKYLKDKPEAGDKVSWLAMLQDQGLRSHITSLFKPEEAGELGAGWLYVFMNGVLWRELAVNGLQLSEVDLSAEKGKDVRDANGAATMYLTLPYKINNKVNKFAVAFSEVQWNWPRMEYYQNKQHQSKRTETLDLGFNKKKSSDQNHNLENYYLLREDMIPTIEVSNPVGLATRLCNDIIIALSQLKDLVAKVTKDPYFKSAHLTYQTFFNPAINTDMAQKDRDYEWDVEHNRGGYMPSEKEMEHLSKEETARQYLDQDKLEKILKIKERRALRCRIRLLQNALAALIQDKKFKITKLNYQYEGVDYQTAFEDHFYSSNYAEGFSAIAGLCSLLGYDPEALDNALDIKPAAENKQLNAGEKLALNIYSKKNYWLYNYVSSNGSEFVAEDFAAAAGVYGSETLMQALTTLTEVLGKTSRKSSSSIGNQLIDELVGLFKATKNKYLQLIKSVSAGDITQDDEIAGYEEENLAEFAKHYNDRAVNMEIIKEDKIPIYKQEVTISAQGINAKTAESSPLGYINQNSAADFYGFAEVQNCSAAEMRVNIINLYQKTGRNLLVYPKDFAAIRKKLILTNKILAPIFMGLQLFNLGTVFKSYQATSISGFKVMAESFFTIYAIEEVAKTYARSIDDYYQFFTESTNNLVLEYMDTVKKVKLILTPLGSLGVIACGISLYFAIGELRESIRLHNGMEIFGTILKITGDSLYILTMLEEGRIAFKRWAQRAAIREGVAVAGEEAAAGGAAELLASLSWVATILLLIGTVIVELCRDDQLTKWAKTSPFSNMGSSEMSDNDAATELLTLLLKPNINLTQQPDTATHHNFYLEMLLPYFTPGKDHLAVQTGKKIITKIMNSIVGAETERASEKPQYLKPIKINQLYDLKNKKFIGLRYYYAEPKRTTKASIAGYSYNSYTAQVRIYFAEGIRIPKEASKDKDNAAWYFSNNLETTT